MARTSLGLTRRRWLRTAGATAAQFLAACGAPPAPPRPEAGPATVQFYFSGGVSEQQLYTSLKEAYERQYPRYKLDLLPDQRRESTAVA